MIIKILRSNANVRSELKLKPRLENYFQKGKGNWGFIPKEAYSIKISGIRNIGGAMSQSVYSMKLSYIYKEKLKIYNLVLKIYFPQNIDPVLEAYILNEDLRRHVREFQTLKSLHNIGFPVPEVYLCESDPIFLGSPFIVMQKEAIIQKKINEIGRFADTLATLHNTKLSELHIPALRIPKNEYSYAKRWPIHFRHYLNFEGKHTRKFKEKFELAIQWLDLNSPQIYCPRYSLIHGDYHPANAYLTSDSRMIILDWESVEIGDPAFDVAYAYHFIKFFTNPANPSMAEKVAERFISEYSRNYLGDVSERIKYYKLVTILGLAIYYSSGLSTFEKIYRYHRRKVLSSVPFLGSLMIFLGSPLIKWRYVAQKLGALDDIYWLRYFEKYLDEIVG